MLDRVNHIAIVVPDLDAAMAHYREVLKAEVRPPVDLPAHGVTTSFVLLSNMVIELLHPLGDESPVAKFLERNPKGGIHHVCFETADLDAAVESVSKDGVRVLGKAKIGAHDRPVAFMHPADNHGCLFELEHVPRVSDEGLVSALPSSAS
ncbi:MAG: methylmalonyl-CoA epimerase [Alphaproteobacteria bacterium]|nr:methylmalonyl-CoA epimerase [Alphaproteobacteria bacterium]